MPFDSTVPQSFKSSWENTLTVYLSLLENNRDKPDVFMRTLADIRTEFTKLIADATDILQSTSKAETTQAYITDLFEQVCERIDLLRNDINDSFFEEVEGEENTESVSSDIEITGQPVIDPTVIDGGFHTDPVVSSNTASKDSLYHLTADRLSTNYAQPRPRFLDFSRG